MAEKSIDPKSLSLPIRHGILQGAVGPRPIAFASTVDKEGNVNLSPFSFFNVFGSNPPTLVFSPSRRGRDNTTKHTFENVKEVPEVVINIVNYPMVQQMSLASTEYDKGVNEFVKSGFTESKSEKVKPPRVAESPVSFECVVKDIIETGQEGGAGNLIICEVVQIHAKEEVLDEKGMVDTTKMDLVGRMGGNWYVRASGDAIFEVPKPLKTLGIGVDKIPEKIRLSKVLTGNDLGMLGNVEELPGPSSVKEIQDHVKVKEILTVKPEGEEREMALHQLAHEELEAGNLEEAWKILLFSLSN